MSIKVMQWVWENSRAQNSARLVLLAIADCAADDGANAWPSIPTVAAKAKLSVRSTQYAINELIAIGELEVDPQSGPNGVNRYRVTMVASDKPRPKRGSLAVNAQTRIKVFDRDGYRCKHCGSSENLQVDHIVPRAKFGSNEIGNLQTLCGTCNMAKGTKPDRIMHPAESAPVRVVHRAESAPAGVQIPAPRGAKSAESSAKIAPVTVLEPSIEPSLEPSAARARGIDTRTVVELAAFFTESVPISNTSRTRSVIAKALGAGFSAERIRTALVTLIAEGRGCTEDQLRIALQGARAPTSTTNTKVAQGLALAARLRQNEQKAIQP